MTKMTSNINEETFSSNVIYLADVRKRFGSGDESPDRPPGAAAARLCELSFLHAIATFQASRDPHLPAAMPNAACAR
jgi:hypothetical protein